MDRDFVLATTVAICANGPWITSKIVVLGDNETISAADAENIVNDFFDAMSSADIDP